MPIVTDPNPNAARVHDLDLIVTIPQLYGKPSDDMKTAQSIKAILQTGLHSRLRVELITEEGDTVEVFDRDWAVVS